MQDFRIIDAIGPFAVASAKPISNWSKVSFKNLEDNNSLDKKTSEKILLHFEEYCKKVTVLGYNAVSIDDLSHTVIHDFYNPQLKKLLKEYQPLYKQLFALAAKYNLAVFLNTDYMFYNKDIDLQIKGKDTNIQQLFLATLEKCFQQYPNIAGIILRIGENDAQDVRGHFLSTLTLKTPKQANIFLKKMLPLFEQYNKALIFRTWTVGVYKIGDLIWNKKTFAKVFSSIQSKSLIISLKYGDTDFFRYLSFNPLFFCGNHKKIIELQTKREWEGMGQYPSFIGWDYKKYLDLLKENKNIVGIHVWCQTGGWTHTTWKSVTFLENSSFWNELNTFVTVKLYVEKKSVEDSIINFCKVKKITDSKSFIDLLQLSEIAIKNGLYIKEFALQTLYFRRVRIPPLAWIAWDRILINPLTKNLLQHTVKNTGAAIKEGYAALDAIKEMIHLGKRIDLDASIVESLQFELATFTLLATIRKMLFFTLSEEEKIDLKNMIQTYDKKYSDHYVVSISSWEQTKKRTRSGKIALHLMLRSQNAYRHIDRIALLTTPMQKYAITQYIKRSSPFLATEAMGIDVLFR